MRQTLLIILLALCSLIGAARTYSVADVPNVHLTDSSRFVSNPDGILSRAEESQLNTIMRQIRRTTSAEPVIVVVDDIDGGDIDGFATDLFESWGLGKKDKDNGLLILVVKDLRRAAIRPGYGLEGLLPDVFCGTVLRNVIFPRFREQEYGQGLIDGSQAIATVLLDPDARDEIMSAEADADFAGSNDDEPDFFTVYLIFAAIVAVIMLAILIIRVYELRGKDRQDRYIELAKLKPLYLALTFLGIFVPLIASLPLLIILYRLRNAPHPCPRCGAAMNKVDEVHDNEFLNPAQDLEERLGSVDYDVWLCPECHETDIEQYVQPASGYKECPRCHTYALKHTGDRITRQPTTLAKGEGVRVYRCVNCNHTDLQPFTIPALPVVPVVLSSGGSRGFGGGGGSFGGGFGGGHTGGGGASGGW